MPPPRVVIRSAPPTTAPPIDGVVHLVQAPPIAQTHGVFISPIPATLIPEVGPSTYVSPVLPTVILSVISTATIPHMIPATIPQVMSTVAPPVLPIPIPPLQYGMYAYRSATNVPSVVLPGMAQTMFPTAWTHPPPMTGPPVIHPYGVLGPTPATQAELPGVPISTPTPQGTLSTPLIDLVSLGPVDSIASDDDEEPPKKKKRSKKKKRKEEDHSSYWQMDIFKKNMGKIFEGTEDAFEAIHWLHDTQITLTSMGCPVQFWTRSAICAMHGFAREWWEGIAPITFTGYTLEKIP